MNKKKLLITSGIISFVGIMVNFIGLYNFKGPYFYLVYNSVLSSQIFIPIFLISLFIYKVRDEIYEAWLKFVYVYVPVFILAEIFSPQFGFILPLPKFVVFFILSVVFFVLSLLIMVVKYFALQRTLISK